ncbi:MAG: RES domain-containing protein [Betaproteobacteria bacterium]|nr:RES domain-containing protein [Betaproteobacteria bacterium]
MSSITWTPHAVASEARPAGLRLWRAVEAQHIASTIRLVDNLGEHDLLEQILEQTKPKLPPNTQGLHYLLATPFRYPPPERGSRFRSGYDPGVFYGADEQRTACAEFGFWRWRFLIDSEGLNELGPVAHTLFQVNVSAKGVDLRKKPFLRQARRWTDPEDYTATQKLGQVARDAKVFLLRYQSVRDPKKGACGALLDSSGFAAPRRPVSEQTWFLTVTRSFSAWKREGEQFELEYGFDLPVRGNK